MGIYKGYWTMNTDGKRKQKFLELANQFATQDHHKLSIFDGHWSQIRFHERQLRGRSVEYINHLRECFDHKRSWFYWDVNPIHTQSTLVGSRYLTLSPSTFLFLFLSIDCSISISTYFILF